MNYLAHLYLSGDSEEIKLGNFIGDFVKGSRHQHYSEQVAYGIILHRNIDTFTDQHALVKECIKLLRPGYGKHSGIVTDIFFDHFLASNWSDYSKYSLRQFAKNTHAILLSNFMMLPFRVQQFLPFLIQHKRLESYSKRENMQMILEIMSRWTSLPSNTSWAIQILNQEYNQFEEHFRYFFPELIDYVEKEFNIKIIRPENSERS